MTYGLEADFDETNNTSLDANQQAKGKRYLVFIGNLAYKTTKADLEKFLKDTCKYDGLNFRSHFHQTADEQGDGEAKGICIR